MVRHYGGQYSDFSQPIPSSPCCLDTCRCTHKCICAPSTTTHKYPHTRSMARPPQVPQDTVQTILAGSENVFSNPLFNDKLASYIGSTARPTSDFVQTAQCIISTLSDQSTPHRLIATPQKTRLNIKVPPVLEVMLKYARETGGDASEHYTAYAIVSCGMARELADPANT